MRKITTSLVAVMLWSGYALAGVPTPQQAEDQKVQAASWMAKSDSVAAIVDAVIGAAVEAGAEQHAVAKDQVNDCKHWQGEAVKSRETAQEAFDAGDYEKASAMGNMAWQYYVKAGTAAVLAARLMGVG